MKPPDTTSSTLSGASCPSDRKLRELRRRAERIGYDIDMGLCAGCDAQLTGVDIDLGACSQCGAGIEVIEKESTNEDL